MTGRSARDADRWAASAVRAASSAVPRQFHLRQAPRSGGPHGWHRCAAAQERRGARSSANCAHESNERANVPRLCRRPIRTTRKKGIREITSFRGTRVAAKNRGRRRAQVSAVLGEKMLPSRLTSFGASGGQSQIFKMQRAEIFFELKRSKGFTRQTLRCATFQCDREMPTRELPACSIGLRVKPLDQGGAVLQRLHRVHGICVSRPAFWIFGHVYSGVHCIPRNPASGYNAALATLKDNPAEGNSRAKRAKKGDATQREFRVSYFSVAHPARNENCLAGLEVGALRRARRSISDFATLVRKSYSGSPSLVSTLVLVEHFLLCWRTWEH